MRRLFTALICTAILSSCEFTRTETIIVKTLDQFDTEQENVQLGIDLINYNHYEDLRRAIPEITEDAINQITCQYFVRDNDHEVSYRLILENDALDYRKKIVPYFEKNIDKQVDTYVERKDIFDQARKISMKYFIALDNDDMDTFWENTHDEFRRITSRDEFVKNLEGREGISDFGGEREFYSQQFNKELPGTEETDFYTSTFAFKKNDETVEQLIYIIEDDELKIIGYDYKMPNRN